MSNCKKRCFPSRFLVCQPAVIFGDSHAGRQAASHPAIRSNLVVCMSSKDRSAWECARAINLAAKTATSSWRWVDTSLSCKIWDTTEQPESWYNYQFIQAQKIWLVDVGRQCWPNCKSAMIWHNLKSLVFSTVRILCESHTNALKTYTHWLEASGKKPRQMHTHTNANRCM